MKNRINRIDLARILIYILKRLWLVVFFAELGFGAVYLYSTRYIPDLFTASGRMYVINASPGVTDEKNINYSDFNTAVQLVNTYLVVVKSDKVMNAVVEQLSESYPGITMEDVSATLSMESVSNTGVVSVLSTTENAQKSADIVNAVLEYAPEEIIRVVGAGSIEIIDYAKVPVLPNEYNVFTKSIQGAAIGAVIAACILTILCLLNRRIKTVGDLTENYTPPVLASIQRIGGSKAKAEKFLLTGQSPMELVEGYAKLRMNMLYTLVGKESRSVVITSCISGEGKTTISSNLGISCAAGGKKTLLIDGDLRRACQSDVFGIEQQSRGLSEILIGACRWQDAVIKNIRGELDLLPVGHFPPNPAELLESPDMRGLLKELEKEYDLVLIDMPPVNIVTDPLVLSDSVAGCLLIARQNFSDHRDIRKALISAEMTGMDVLGFVFFGEQVNQGGYYSRRYYKKYYSKYDYRKRSTEAANGMTVDHTDAKNADTGTVSPEKKAGSVAAAQRNPAEVSPEKKAGSVAAAQGNPAETSGKTVLSEEQKDRQSVKSSYFKNN